MEIIQGFIIYLSNYPDSVSMANRAMETGTMRGWKLQLFEGVNGTQTGLADYNLKPNNHKKAKRLLERPGTQGCFPIQSMVIVAKMLCYKYTHLYIRA